ncbi:hypothetical protein N7486_004175 [Penicillium sp. IBT 16267x]|nr:hypothetical protein N7486_004175 [Penicillium sp. IBT 16267x]
MFDRDDCPEHGHRDDRGFDILQFTTHILGARPADQLRYRNRTRLKYHFEAINIAKDLARLMDSTGGTTAISVCASTPIRAAIHRVIHTRWWTDDDPFDPATSETISAETGTGSETAWKPPPLSDARTAPGQTGRLSGETLVDNRRSWQGDPLAVGGQSSNHQMWVRQKIIEGGF